MVDGFGGEFSRRELLRSSAALAATPLLQQALPREAPAVKTQRVVLVAFAGGVRSKEVLGTPQNVPNLMRIARAGVTFPKVRCANVGHYGAALSLFTGNVEALGIRDSERTTNPTLFEILRKDGGFDAGDVWLSTTNGAQGRLFAHSDNPAYGASFAAQVFDSDGIFNVEFKRLIDSFGRPKPETDAERTRLDRLAHALRRPGSDDNGSVRQRDVERFILDELGGANARLTGPGAADAKAIRVGTNLLRAFRPRLLGITLQNADVAHSSYNAYVEVIRRNDEELGKLWDMIRGDADLRDTTSLLIVPEFGRDQNLNQRNGLDHGDGSDEMQQVFLIGAGPETARDKVVSKEIRTIDVCPTVLGLLGCKTPSSLRARAIRELRG
ncbi:MAG: hypothetical protein R3F56_00730 [Planctomycetota bacterium]